MSKRNKTCPLADMVFLANRIDTFVELVQDPQGFFKRYPDEILPGSLDHQLIAAAFYLLVDCYLRSKGLKAHPRSKTQIAFMEALTEVAEAVIKEVKARPYMYPKLSGLLGRGEAAIELDLLMQGFHFDSGEENGV